jgi:hypothetical protein
VGRTFLCARYDEVRESGAGELGPAILGGGAQMRISTSEGIKPLRIGSLQSWNRSSATEVVGDNGMGGDGVLWFADAACKDVGDRGDAPKYHELGEPGIDA